MTYPFVISTDNSEQGSPLPKDLDGLRMPSHIAIIMDGNGRWAKQKDYLERLDIRLVLML